MKLHKLTIVALFIWLANSIYGIKLKAFKPYFWALVMFIMFLSLTSCRSGWSCQKRYVETPKEKVNKFNKPLA